MQEAGCKYHSERKVQRLCADGKVDCYRLQTTRSGQPVTEWLVNGTALLEHVRKFELMRDDSRGRGGATGAAIRSWRRQRVGFRAEK